MCRVSATFPRRSFKDGTTSSARQPPPGICIGPGPRRTWRSCRTQVIRHSRREMRTNSCSRLIGTEAGRSPALRGWPGAGRLRCCALAAAALIWSSASHAAATKLLRFPNVWHDRIVFSYAGDLWTVGTQGGTAARLTSNPGLELFGKFSPDGRYIAFTGQYGG